MLKEQGFSLLSTMIGLVIGLLVSATALGTVTFLEAQKRTSMGGNSALVNGGLGLFRIENETKLAGLGLMSKQSLACQNVNLSYKKTVLLDGAPLYPAAIVDGAAGSDTLSIAYLDTLTGAAPVQLLLPMATATDSLKLSTSSDAVAGRIMLIQDALLAAPCTVMQMTAVTASGFGNDVTHTTGDFNGGTFTTPVAYVENSHASISKALVWSTFRVNNKTLEEVNNITGAISVVADGVVGLKAQYGTTDGATGASSITGWTSATGTYAAPTAADMLKVRAVRVGVAVRSLEKDSSCAATAKVLPLWANGPTVDVSIGTADWNCYKYRTFNLVIPLVNVVMGAR